MVIFTEENLSGNLIFYAAGAFTGSEAMKRNFEIDFKLTLTISCISESCIAIKIKLNLYFNTSLWFLKKFLKAFKALEQLLQDF